MKIVALIPSRLDSTRLPKKPLINFLGLPMIEHVRRRALLCKQFNKVIIATCDKKIFDVIVSYGGDLYPLDRKGGGLDMVLKLKLLK